jgi:hypothetical protein
MIGFQDKLVDTCSLRGEEQFTLSMHSNSSSTETVCVSVSRHSLQSQNCSCLSIRECESSFLEQQLIFTVLSPQKLKPQFVFVSKVYSCFSVVGYSFFWRNTSSKIIDLIRKMWFSSLRKSVSLIGWHDEEQLLMIKSNTCSFIQKNNSIAWPSFIICDSQGDHLWFSYMFLF